MSEVYSWNENQVIDLWIAVRKMLKFEPDDIDYKKLETDLMSIKKVMELTGLERVYVKGRDPDKL